MEEKEAERKRKAELRQKQVGERRTKRGKKQDSANESGLQSAEISSNECAVCLGSYEDDIECRDISQLSSAGEERLFGSLDST